MHPDISEFSYGYAVTESLVSASPTPIRAAPIFPSLIEEGKSGGYDVHLPFDGFPLFLQFKLSHRMVRHYAQEALQGILSVPFFRMHLRPTRHSQQHPMLLALESTGAAVFYVAPYFHTPAELNDAYASAQVVQRSLFIRPLDIGGLPDDRDHHLAFRRGYGVYMCSDSPHRLRDSIDGPNELEHLLSGPLLQRERISSTRESVHAWTSRLTSIVKEHRQRIGWLSEEGLSAVEQLPPLSQFVYLARAFFGCNVVLVAPAEQQVQSGKA